MPGGIFGERAWEGRLVEVAQGDVDDGGRMRHARPVSARAELPEGALLAGRYRIVHALGSGGMGTVYEAMQDDLGRRVAVKVLHRLLAQDAAHCERFRREAEAAGQLGHPNIVRVTDFGQAPGESAFLVMEFVAGRTLVEVVRDEAPLAFVRVAQLAIQILSALAAVHRAGIVHRDLKPSNVMIVPIAGLHEQVKLLDFGIAKMREGPGYARLTATGAMVGTPGHMAPEQVLGHPVDARTDIYAVGVLMYEALTKVPPVDVGPMGEQVQRILAIDPAPVSSLRPDVPPTFAAAVMRAMARLPADRFPSADDFAEAIRPFAFAEQDTVRDREPPPTRDSLRSEPQAQTRLDRAPPAEMAQQPAPVRDVVLPGASRPRRLKWVLLGCGAAAAFLLCAAAGVWVFWLGPSMAGDGGFGGAAACADTCKTAGNRRCEDGRPGSVSALCAPGTDCTDCNSPAACDDTCEWAHDRQCDDGRPGSYTRLCAPDTDCTDCGGTPTPR